MTQRMRSRTPWREKLEKVTEFRLVDTPPKMQQRFGPGKMLIARPLDIDALIRRIPAGKVATVNQIMERLARDHHAATTCPLTTGIFIRIIAEVAEEDRRAGKSEITPYWRVIKSDGSLNPKYPGGTDAQSKHLNEEGHSIEPVKGKKPPKVKDFERALIDF
ncbi:MAG: MGMT family protein [bacterium]